MMSFRRGFPFFIFSILFLAASCGPAEKDRNETATASGGITDALGRTVQLNQPVNRVVTISPGATEIVVAAGGLSKLVGVSNVDNYPDAISQLPRFSVLPMDFEAIVALVPDLVIASSQVNDPQNVKVFDALNIKVFFLDGTTWNSVSESIATAGALLETDSIAAASKASLQADVERLISITKHVSKRPTAIFLISEITSYSFGKGSYVQDLLAWAGVESATATIGTNAPLSDEWVLMEDPEIIFGTFGDDFEASDLIKYHPTWSDLKAIKSGSVFSIPQNLILRPGPRNVEAAYLMAGKAHPELLRDLFPTL